MQPLYRNYDVIEQDNGVTFKKDPQSVDFSNVTKLQCFIVVAVKVGKVEILAVFSKQILAKTFMWRKQIEEKYDGGLSIIESVMYNTVAIINNQVKTIITKTPHKFDADFNSKGVIDIPYTRKIEYKDE